MLVQQLKNEGSKALMTNEVAKPPVGSNLHSDLLPVQRQAVSTNRTGMPDQLKNGVEQLSGISMDDVKVHYNSAQPAQLNAHAFAQGTDIHIAPGQERHLPHEAWHVVQQKQGRVKPTRQLKSKVNINDDPKLEREADVMGARAAKTQEEESINVQMVDVESAASSIRAIQLMPQYEHNGKKRNVIKRILKDAVNRAIKQDLIPDSYLKNIRGEKQLNESGEAAVDGVFEIYKNVTIHLTDFLSVMHQISQDLHLYQKGNTSLIGTPHQHSEFTYTKTTDKNLNVSYKSGHSKGGEDQRVYRTMTKADWDNDHISGHGGSLGQAMYYFDLGKVAVKADPKKMPDYLVEFKFNGKRLPEIVEVIKSNGEGELSTEDMLGGKTEKNSSFGYHENIFSVDLRHASGMLNKDFVDAKVLASTNGELPDIKHKKNTNNWRMRPK